MIAIMSWGIIMRPKTNLNVVPFSVGGSTSGPIQHRHIFKIFYSVVCNIIDQLYQVVDEEELPLSILHTL